MSSSTPSLHSPVTSRRRFIAHGLGVLALATVARAASNDVVTVRAIIQAPLQRGTTHALRLRCMLGTTQLFEATVAAGNASFTMPLHELTATIPSNDAKLQFILTALPPSGSAITVMQDAALNSDHVPLSFNSPGGSGPVLLKGQLISTYKAAIKNHWSGEVMFPGLLAITLISP